MNKSERLTRKTILIVKEVKLEREREGGGFVSLVSLIQEAVVAYFGKKTPVVKKECLPLKEALDSLRPGTKLPTKL